MNNSIGTLLGEAVNIMITGMGVVFVFLTIMVYLVGFMSKLLPKEEPIAPPNRKNKQSQTALADDSVSPQVIAAISAAVHSYRSASASTSAHKRMNDR